MTKQEEEQHKQLVEQHQFWLKQPVTNEALKLIANHRDKFRDALQKNVLISTDEKTQEQHRNCMKTCEALLSALNDSEKFIALIKLINK